METMNSMGFNNFWGVTPAYNIFGNEYSKIINRGEDNSINVMISNSNDIRHVLKTISNFLEKFPNEKENSNNCNKVYPQFNFYLYESIRENLARTILFLQILNDCTISIRDRVEIIMEIYGNTLLSSRTAEYLNSIYKELMRYVSGDDKYKGCLREVIDLSLLTFKEKDDIVEIFNFYDLKYEFDIEKYREDRLRYHYKERYDYRKNISDWDYHYNLKPFAPIVKLRHYIDFRDTGVTFEMKISKYNIPNRTLSSYIPGREKKSKDSCFVRGYWGDIINSPFIGFGVELDDSEEFKHFYQHNQIDYIYNSQEVTEFNLLKYLYRIEKNQLYDYLSKEKEKRNKGDVQPTDNDICMKKDTQDIMETYSSNIENIILQGFKKMNIKIYLFSGNLENFIKKKKFQNFFDFVLLGFHSKNIIDKVNLIGKPDVRLIIELNEFMACFKEKEKELYRDKIRTVCKELGFILEDTSFKHTWKFFYKEGLIENYDVLNPKEIKEISIETHDESP